MVAGQRCHDHLGSSGCRRAGTETLIVASTYIVAFYVLAMGYRHLAINVGSEGPVRQLEQPPHSLDEDVQADKDVIQ